jgi:predicted ATPase with chaperone activity
VTAIERLGLSARACHRVLKPGTCADLAGEAQIRRNAVSEAIGLRVLDPVLREEH